MKKTVTARKREKTESSPFRFDLSTFMPYRISILATLVRKALSEIYKDEPGLSDPEWRVLTTVAHKGPLASGDIGLHMTLDRMAISRGLTRLIKLKLVTRAPLERDQRMTEVKLSEHGEYIFSALARQATEIEKVILDPLSKDEAAEFLRLIDKIEMNFRAHSNPRRPTLIHTARAISKRRARS